MLGPRVGAATLMLSDKMQLCSVAHLGKLQVSCRSLLAAHNLLEATLQEGLLVDQPLDALPVLSCCRMPLQIGLLGHTITSFCQLAALQPCLKAATHTAAAASSSLTVLYLCACPEVPGEAVQSLPLLAMS